MLKKMKYHIPCSVIKNCHPAARSHGDYSTQMCLWWSKENLPTWLAEESRLRELSGCGRHIHEGEWGSSMCDLFRLLVMGFRLQLQAEFEGRLIISPLPPPPWVEVEAHWGASDCFTAPASPVGGGRSSPSNPRNRCRLFLACGTGQLSLPCSRFASLGWEGNC